MEIGPFRQLFLRELQTVPKSANPTPERAPKVVHDLQSWREPLDGNIERALYSMTSRDQGMAAGIGRGGDDSTVETGANENRSRVVTNCVSGVAQIGT